MDTNYKEDSTRRTLLLGLASMALPHVAWSQANSYPTKPITLVVPFSPGGTTDILARLLAKQLAIKLGGATIVIENKGGAGGVIGTSSVAKATPDGYTLLMGAIGTHAINPHLYRTLSYDANKDFVPVSLVAMVPNVLVVYPSLPVKSVRELIAYAKANPNKVTYGSAGTGTSIHLSGAMFEQLAQVEMLHIPYRGSGPALTDLVAGQLSCMFDNLPSSLPHIKANTLRALAVTSTARSSVLPDLPTIAQAGVPEYSATSWFGIWAPAGTPAALITRLNSEINHVLSQADMKQSFKEHGAEIVLQTPEQFREFIQTESNRWSKIVKGAKAQLE